MQFQMGVCLVEWKLQLGWEGSCLELAESIQCVYLLSISCLLVEGYLRVFMLLCEPEVSSIFFTGIWWPIRKRFRWKGSSVAVKNRVLRILERDYIGNICVHYEVLNVTG